MSSERQKMEVKTWNMFSVYIRMRDAKDLNGFARCCTCGGVHFWKEMDAGHFVGRQYKNLKFSGWNNHAQCRPCNRFNEGMKAAYEKFLDKKYGPGTAAVLEASKKSFYRLEIFQLQAIYDECSEKIRELKKVVPQDFP